MVCKKSRLTAGFGTSGTSAKALNSLVDNNIRGSPGSYNKFSNPNYSSANYSLTSDDNHHTEGLHYTAAPGIRGRNNSKGRSGYPNDLSDPEENTTSILNLNKNNLNKLNQIQQQQQTQQQNNNLSNGIGLDHQNQTAITVVPGAQGATAAGSDDNSTTAINNANRPALKRKQSSVNKSQKKYKNSQLISILRHDPEDESGGIGSLCTRIALSPRFDTLALIVIVLNALWMGIEVDHHDMNDFKRIGPLRVQEKEYQYDNNTQQQPLDADDKENLNFTYKDATVDPYFVVENVFTLFFVSEILIKMLSYRQPLRGYFILDLELRNWNIFDFVLVVLMVVENWILSWALSGESGAALGALSALRLLRLCRISRLFLLVPELGLMVKSIASAARSVSSTIVLVLGLMYVYAIVMTEWGRNQSRFNGSCEGGKEIVVTDVPAGPGGRRLFDTDVPAGPGGRRLFGDVTDVPAGPGGRRMLFDQQQYHSSKSQTSSSDSISGIPQSNLSQQSKYGLHSDSNRFQDHSPKGYFKGSQQYYQHKSDDTDIHQQWSAFSSLPQPSRYLKGGSSALADGTDEIDCSKVINYFGGLGWSLMSLMQILVYDDFGLIRAVFLQEPVLGAALIVFIILAAFTVLNQLIGVICEIVSSTKATEEEKKRVFNLERIFDDHLDIDGNGVLSVEEIEVKKEEMKVSVLNVEEIEIKKEEMKILLTDPKEKVELDEGTAVLCYNLLYEKAQEDEKREADEYDQWQKDQEEIQIQQQQQAQEIESVQQSLANMEDGVNQNSDHQNQMSSDANGQQQTQGGPGPAVHLNLDSQQTALAIQPPTVAFNMQANNTFQIPPGPGPNTVTINNLNNLSNTRRSASTVSLSTTAAPPQLGQAGVDRRNFVHTVLALVHPPNSQDLIILKRNVGRICDFLQVRAFDVERVKSSEEEGGGGLNSDDETNNGGGGQGDDANLGDSQNQQTGPNSESMQDAMGKTGSFRKKLGRSQTITQFFNKSNSSARFGAAGFKSLVKRSNSNAANNGGERGSQSLKKSNSGTTNSSNNGKSNLKDNGNNNNDSQSQQEGNIDSGNESSTTNNPLKVVTGVLASGQSISALKRMSAHYSGGHILSSESPDLDEDPNGKVHINAFGDPQETKRQTDSILSTTVGTVANGNSMTKKSRLMKSPKNQVLSPPLSQKGDVMINPDNINIEEDNSHQEIMGDNGTTNGNNNQQNGNTNNIKKGTVFPTLFNNNSTNSNGVPPSPQSPSKSNVGLKIRISGKMDKSNGDNHKEQQSNQNQYQQNNNYNNGNVVNNSNQILTPSTQNCTPAVPMRIPTNGGNFFQLTKQMYQQQLQAQQQQQQQQHQLQSQQIGYQYHGSSPGGNSQISQLSNLSYQSGHTNFPVHLPKHLQYPPNTLMKQVVDTVQAIVSVSVQQAVAIQMQQQQNQLCQIQQTQQQSQQNNSQIQQQQNNNLNKNIVLQSVEAALSLESCLKQIQDVCNIQEKLDQDLKLDLKASANNGNITKKQQQSKTPKVVSVDWAKLSSRLRECLAVVDKLEEREAELEVQEKEQQLQYYQGRTQQATL